MRSSTPSSRRTRDRRTGRSSRSSHLRRACSNSAARRGTCPKCSRTARLHGHRSRDLAGGRSARRAAHRARDRRRRGEDRLRRRARGRGVRRRPLRGRARAPEKSPETSCAESARSSPRTASSSPRSRTSRTAACASRSWAASSGIATGVCSTTRIYAFSRAPRSRTSSRRPVTWSRTGRGSGSTSGRRRSASRKCLTRCASGSPPILRRPPTSSCSGRSHRTPPASSSRLRRELEELEKLRPQQDASPNWLPHARSSVELRPLREEVESLRAETAAVRAPMRSRPAADQRACRVRRRARERARSRLRLPLLAPDHTAARSERAYAPPARMTPTGLPLGRRASRLGRHGHVRQLAARPALAGGSSRAHRTRLRADRRRQRITRRHQPEVE